jgi:inhibitor of cysteine peptidase
MKDNKELYIKANDEIKPSEKLKRMTKNRVIEKSKSNYRNAFLRFANGTIIILLVFSVLWLTKESSKQENQIDKFIRPNAENAKAIKTLPTVGSKENLLGLLKKVSNQNRENAYSDEGDSFVAQDSMQESNKTAERLNTDHSDTNIQVDGVKEGDIVKTDGQYIYYLSVSKLVVVDAKTPSKLKIAKEIEYTTNQEAQSSFYPNELFIQDNKLVVIGTENKYNTSYKAMEGQAESNMIYPMNNNTTTSAIVYDVADKEKMSVVRRVDIDGSYLSARMIGNHIYMISNKHLYTIYNNQTITDDYVLKPGYVDTAVSEEKKLIDYSQICYFPDNISESSYMITAGFDITNNSAANVETYLGVGSTIYSSKDNLYVAKTKYTNDNVLDQARAMIGISSYEAKTELYKFKLENGKIEYKINGTVPGSVINQFSMDEYNGNFRVATTQYLNWDTNNTTNNLYILDENLSTIGKLENLAKGERIYSVRFMQGKAYIVTFKQVDPLFVIDVSNPTSPKVLGELKIPGYSQYLHPYDETHLIGFGRDTQTVNDVYGQRVVNKGIKMALFDVADVNNPKELYSVKIGDIGTYSEVLDNHKALLFSKEKNIIAFPISVSEGENYGTKLTFQGAIIFGLSLDSGFTERGRIGHLNITKGYGDYDYTKQVERIIYIGDTLFTLSKGMIKATDLNTMKELGKVEISVKENVGIAVPYID